MTRHCNNDYKNGTLRQHKIFKHLTKILYEKTFKYQYILTPQYSIIIFIVLLLQYTNIYVTETVP